MKRPTGTSIALPTARGATLGSSGPARVRAAAGASGAPGAPTGARTARARNANEEDAA